MAEGCWYHTDTKQLQLKGLLTNGGVTKVLLSVLIVKYFMAKQINLG